MNQPEHIFTDPSLMSSEQLAGLLIEVHRSQEVELLQPAVPPRNDIEATLQARIQRVQTVPQYSAEAITEKYLKGIYRLRPDAPKPDDLNKIINNRGQSAVREGLLKDAGLSRIEQILLLRGVVLATNARYRESASDPTKRSFSKNQSEIQATAVRSIHHFATNPVHVSHGDQNGGVAKFLNAYSASYIAKLIEQEVFATDPPVEYDETSIIRAMAIAIPFGRLLSRWHDVTQSIFAVGGSERVDSGDTKEFQARHITEIDRSRISELMKLKGILGDEFTSYNFYDTVRPFMPQVQPAKKPERLDGEKIAKAAKNIPEKQDRELHESEDYVVLEIAAREEDGREKIHVVADNAEVDNACYALRQEVLDEWHRILGSKFSWQDVFTQRKEVVRQLGAKSFHHNKGSNVPARVKAYLTQDEESVVTLAFSRIFDSMPGSKKELFDDQMKPTRYNKMPPILINQIQKSEVLKAFWPMIREHGYIQTHRMIKALQLGQIYEAPQRPIDKLAPVQELAQKQVRNSVSDIWKRILDSEIVERYSTK